MSYVDEVERQERSRGGYLVTQEGYRGMVCFPSWATEGNYKATTIVPIFTPTPDGMRFAPHRLGNGPRQYAAWICARYLARGWGSSKQFTFTVSQKDETGGFRDQQLNPNPAHILFKAWQALCKADKNWENLGKGGDRRRAAISAPDNYVFIQGMIIEHNGKATWKRTMQPIYPALLGMTKTARRALETELERKTEQNLLAVPDIFDPQHPLAISIFNKAVKPDDQPGGQPAIPMIPDGSQGFQQAASEERTFGEYGVKLAPIELPRDNQGRPTLVAQNLFTPWDRVFRYLTDEEMVDLLCSAFEDYPQLLIYAFGTQFRLPDRILKAGAKPAVARPQAPSMPGFASAGQAVPSFGGQPGVPQMGGPGYPYQAPVEDSMMAVAGAADPAVGSMPMAPTPSFGRPVDNDDEERKIRDMGLVQTPQPQQFQAPQPQFQQGQPQFQMGGFTQPAPQMPQFQQQGQPQRTQMFFAPPNAVAPQGQRQVTQMPQPPMGMAAVPPPAGLGVPQNQTVAPSQEINQAAAGLEGLARARREMNQG